MEKYIEILPEEEIVLRRKSSAESTFFSMSELADTIKIERKTLLVLSVMLAMLFVGWASDSLPFLVVIVGSLMILGASQFFTFALKKQKAKVKAAALELKSTERVNKNYNVAEHLRLQLWRKEDKELDEFLTTLGRAPYFYEYQSVEEKKAVADSTTCP